jgi:histidine ammonia-lyase
MLLLKIQSLSYGYSGVQTQTVELNRFIIMIFYRLSIHKVLRRTSGDLAPLAHCLLLEKEKFILKEKVDSSVVMKHFEWEPILLKSKEGLALLNGTQFMSAYGTLYCNKGPKLCYFQI